MCLNHKGETKTHSDFNQPLQNDNEQGSRVCIVAAFMQQLEHIVLLNVISQKRKKRQSYSNFDGQWANFTRNRRTGSSAGQPEKRNKYPCHKLRVRNLPHQTLTRIMV